MCIFFFHNKKKNFFYYEKYKYNIVIITFFCNFALLLQNNYNYGKENS
jgi:hypothetical protein